MRYSAGGVNTIQNGAGSARSVVARLLTLTVITIFCCFLCHYAVNWCDLHYICYFTAGFGYSRRLVSKHVITLTHSLLFLHATHLWYVISIFKTSILFTWPL